MAWPNALGEFASYPSELQSEKLRLKCKDSWNRQRFLRSFDETEM
jgi:hypothetical protein